ncbi:MAG: hypothetical protein A2Z34_11560 [Planctomycetes bacterium RBG_16_59_8]|nr:MAG: hypothetical protein A2Z34_11560 [Planctomycetes bacterium RBG_16_59_8]
MPAGFTKKRRVGAVRNDGSGNFLRFVQEGNVVLLLTGQFVLVAGTATTFTAVDCSAYIPTTSRRGIFELAAVVTHSVAGVSFNASLARNGEAGGQVILNASTQVANVPMSLTGQFLCVTDSTRKVQYMIDTVPNVSGGAYVAVWGYHDRM